MANLHKKHPRTYARNRFLSRKGNEKIYETDSLFFLKLVGVIILGSFWLKFASAITLGDLHINALPIGAIVCFFLITKYEKYQFNRKIWYAVLMCVTILSYFLPSGILL